MLWQVMLAFDPPALLAAREVMLRRHHALAAAWIFALERLVRKILVACALGLRLPPPAPRAPHPRQRTRTLALWWIERPATWPVRFRLYVQRSGWRPHRRREHVSPTVPTLRLAFRLEAVAAVLRDPRLHIRRAARTIARLQAANARSNEPRDLVPLLLPEPRNPWSTPNRAAQPADAQAGGLALYRLAYADTS